MIMLNEKLQFLVTILNSNNVEFNLKYFYLVQIVFTLLFGFKYSNISERNDDLNEIHSLPYSHNFPIIGGDMSTQIDKDENNRFNLLNQ